MNSYEQAIAASARRAESERIRAGIEALIVKHVRDTPFVYLLGEVLNVVDGKDGERSGGAQ